MPASEIAAPAYLRGSRLALIRMSDNAELYIGDNEDEARDFFHAAPNSYEFRELPVGFQSPYHTDGFDNGQIGYGFIFYDSRLVQATYQEGDITDADVMSSEQQYEDAFDKPSKYLQGPLVRYWFWDDALHKERLMLCAVQNSKVNGRFQFTLAVGDDIVMDALRMSPAAADQDRGAFVHVPRMSATPPHP